MITVANAKKAALLEEQRAYANTLTYRLFVNDAVIDGDTVAADLTECADGGYAAQTGVGFAAATLNGADRGEILAPPVTWVFEADGGSFDVWGYYVTDPADDDALVFTDKRDAPFEVTESGTPYTVTPRIELDTLA